jgi:hypothetical protein
VAAIRNVQSETRHGEMEATGLRGKATLVSYSKPFQGLNKITLPNGSEIISGFDGRTSWSVGPQGAALDKTPVEAARPDARPAICAAPARLFPEIGIRRSHRLRRPPMLLAARHYALVAKDNNQFYDVKTGFTVFRCRKPLTNVSISSIS